MKPYIKVLSEKAPFYVSAHPNAGLPNQFGGYDESPEDMTLEIKPFLEERQVNIIGGCCGTTPDHIRALAREAAQYNLRKIPVRDTTTRLSGLEVLTISKESNFINIGERTNVRNNFV